MCYDNPAVDSFAVEEVNAMDPILTFLVSVGAGVVAYYICKWLDRSP